MTVRRTRNNQLPARNRRSVAVAQQAITKFVKPLAQEQYVNALAVNGYSCVVYNRLQGGRVCTCSRTITSNQTGVLDQQGNAPASVIDSLLSGTAVSVKVNPYGVRTSPPQPIVMGDVLPNVISPAQGYEDDDESNPLASFIDGDTTSEEFTDLNLDAEGNGTCGVCFGTGVVGGFAVFNGLRIVLDTSAEESIENLNDASVLTNQYPNCFDLFSSSSYVVFKLILPVGIRKTDNLTLWNNTVKLNDYTLEISEDASIWSSLDDSSILNFRTGSLVYIKVSNVEKFTHLELQFNCSSVETHVEYPRLTKTNDTTVLDSIDSVQLVLSPLVPSVQPWDLIFDNVFQKLWVVESSNWFNDRERNIHGWDINARLVQEYETYSRLKGRNINARTQTTILNR